MPWALVVAALGFVAHHGPPALRAQLPALAIAASDNSGVGDSRFPDSSDYVPDRLFNASGESNKLLSSDWRPEVFRGKFPLARFLDSVSEKTPGLFLTGLIGAAANALSHHTPGINQLLWGFVGGTAVGTMLRAADTEAQTMKRAAPGILFAKLRLLRIGIVLYGAKLTWSAVLGIGWPASFLLDLYAVASTLVLGSLLGRALGLSESLSTLISTGAAICGASAVAAAQPMIDAEAHEVGAALGTVVYFGTIAMCLYPWLYKTVPMLAADPRLMGIYTGATVHEMSGVVQAGAAMVRARGFEREPSETRTRAPLRDATPRPLLTADRLPPPPRARAWLRWPP